MFVQHGNQGFHCLETGTGEAFCQIVQTEQNDAADYFCRECLSGSHCMGHDHVFLKLYTVLFGNDNIAEFAESCGNTINDFFAFYKVINDFSGCTDAFHCLLVQFHESVKTADCHQFVQSQCFPCYYYCLHKKSSSFLYVVFL